MPGNFAFAVISHNIVEVSKSSDVICPHIIYKSILNLCFQLLFAVDQF
jgi:hypothetical protein